MSTEFILQIPNIPLAEFDIGGVLYHARYFHLYESAREAFLRQVNCPYPEFVRNGCHLAIVESHQSFNKPVVYGQPITVHLSTRELKRSSFVFDYEIRSLSHQETILHTSFTRHAFVQTTARTILENGTSAENSTATFRPAVMPENLRRALVTIGKPEGNGTIRNGGGQ